MGLFGKLKDILFDEETVEIPVITKEEKKSEKVKEKTRDEYVEEEVKIEKIVTPPKRKPILLDDEEEGIFDMPKLKTEPKAVEEEVKVNANTKTFTFPVFDDEEITREEPVKQKRQLREIKEEPKRPERPVSKEKRASGYTNAYDYSYGKYKGDYKSSREADASRVAKILEKKEEKKAFTPSPIISPVYGVLNENYKKEDIVTKSEKKKSTSQSLDLDSVRRKAYGTLEDEIEVSLTKKDEYFDEESVSNDYDIVEDDGISIDDLLVDKNETEELNGFSIDDNLEFDETELFNANEEDKNIPDEIDIDETVDDVSNSVDSNDLTNDENNIEDEIDLNKDIYEFFDEENAKINSEKTENKNEGIGEEDLFDLIDSIYERKEDK